jgi:cytochrome c
VFIPPRAVSAAPAFRALVFSEAAGYRHGSIAAGVTMFNQLATANKISGSSSVRIPRR